MDAAASFFNKFFLTKHDRTGIVQCNTNRNQLKSGLIIYAMLSSGRKIYRYSSYPHYPAKRVIGHGVNSNDLYK